MAKTSDVFTYDLMSKLRRDPKQAQAVHDAMRRIDIINAAIKEGKASRADLSEAQSKIIPLCNFNFGMLIPHFFPRYPELPLNLMNRPFMFAMTCLAPDSVVTLKAGRQVGKCVTADTLVDVRGSGEVAISDMFAQGVNVTL